MNRQFLIDRIREKKSYLCVGLDTDPALIPPHLLNNEDPIFAFNKAIIDATSSYCVAYKINTAFYESHGVKGWNALEKTVQYIPASHFKIADAKRGDIGNTSVQYAKAFLQHMAFDSITIAPYMGADSIQPFLQFEDKWAIVLGLTSNPGAGDFELKKLENGLFLYESVISTVATWGSTENLMFVVGATRDDAFFRIRKLIPNHFLLVPGIGAQGGSLEEISEKAMNPDVGLLVNVSRDIIYSSNGFNFAEKAGEKAREYAVKMSTYL